MLGTEKISIFFMLFITFNVLGQVPTNIAKNQCISLDKPIYCNKQAQNWTSLEALSDGDERTQFESSGPLEIALQVDAESTNSSDLIVHWRTNSWKDRDDNYKSFKHLQILTSHNSTNGIDGTWDYVMDYVNHSKDNYITFPNNHPKWVKIKELMYGEISLTRLEVFTSAPVGEKNDIWLFLGDSETKGAMSGGTTNYLAETMFGNKIHEDYPCYYPIVINAGKGGERAPEGLDILAVLINEHPEIALVAFSYGLNDVMLSKPLLVPYSNTNNDVGTKVYTDAYKDIISLCQQHGMFPIPSRISWVQFPNNYCGYVDISGNQSNGITPINVNEVDPIIQSLTPYAVDPNTNLAYADFDTWFHVHAYEYKVFRYDKVHYDRKGINKFNQLWVNAAEQIIYANQGCSGSNSNITISCPSNKMVTLQPNQSTAIVNWSLPSVATDCSLSSDVIPVQILGAASGTSLGEGSYTISYSATDECGQTANCNFSIIISKLTNATLCQAIQGFSFIGEKKAHGYYLSNNEMTWEEAEIYTMENGGYLTTISTDAENEFIRTRLGQSLAFIGVNDANIEGVLEWSHTDSQALDKTYNNYPGNDFGVINFWNGTWEMNNQWVRKKCVMEQVCAVPMVLQVNCPDSMSIATVLDSIVVTWDLPTAITSCGTSDSITIVQIDGINQGATVSVGSYTISYAIADLCGNHDTCTFVITVFAQNLSDCGDVSGYTKLGVFNNHAYYLSSKQYNWEAAKVKAVQDGGYLTSITSELENEFIRSNLENNMVLIGLSDASNEGELQWANGEGFGFNVSAANSAERDYAVMNFWDGKWEMNTFWVSKNYVMEMNCPTTANRIKYQEPTLAVWPNPVHDHLSLTILNSISETVEIELFTLNGELMYSKVSELSLSQNIFNIDVSNMKHGVYFVRVSGADLSKTVKIVH